MKKQAFPVLVTVTCVFLAFTVGMLVGRNTVSGSIQISEGRTAPIHADKAPETSEIDASAGNIEIYLPEKTDMTLEADISAGDFNSEIPFAKKGDAYIFGNGKSKMDIDASAGDINIKKK